MKTTDRKIKRVKKKRSISNSHCKSKCTKNPTEYSSKPKEKTSSRTSSTFAKGSLYNTFYQKEHKGDTNEFSNFTLNPSNVLVSKSKKKIGKNSNRGEMGLKINPEKSVNKVKLTRRKSSIKGNGAKQHPVSLSMFHPKY
mmetsp:Transcript_31110/g.27510  ORF Transcript_31110/g.27510 Transcript_31110/m.27510 type:complete len:140 (+) Transcript_31110:452-871(+)